MDYDQSVRIPWRFVNKYKFSATTLDLLNKQLWGCNPIKPPNDFLTLFIWYRGKIEKEVGSWEEERNRNTYRSVKSLVKLPPEGGDWGLQSEPLWMIIHATKCTTTTLPPSDCDKHESLKTSAGSLHTGGILIVNLGYL